MKKYFLIIILLLFSCDEITEPIIEGCTTATACNYDVTAGKDNGSCVAPQGCNEWCEGDSLSVQELDCKDICGGEAILDECGLCSGDGIANGFCDCNNEYVSLWGECYNIEETDSLFLTDGEIAGEIPSGIGNLTNLTVLDLGGNGLTGSIPPEIGNLTNLSYLDLSDNQLTTLPDSIVNLSNLVLLHLDNNQITSIPINIGNLNKLEILRLGENQLTSLPESIGDLSSLESLVLNNNQLTSLPESIGDLSSLYLLFLISNQLTTLPESIGDLSSLSLLLLTGNQLTGLPQNICNLPPDCFIFVSLNYLCEEFNYDCVEGWGVQDQSNCCEGENGEPNWTQCP